MKRKRAKGEGHIRKRKDGRWEGILTVGTWPDGRQKTRSVYGKTKQEVAEKLAELRVSLQRGTYVDPSLLTLAEWAKTWLERKAQEVKPKTVQVYLEDLSLVMPELRGKGRGLGSLKLQAVKPSHIQGAMDFLVKEGFSPRTTLKVYQLLRALFDEAVRLELIARNPVSLVRPPRKAQGREAPPEKPGRALEPHEVEALLQAAEGHPLELFFRLLLGLGLRKGEALGLKWGDIDFEKGELRVQRAWGKVGSGGEISTPKTPKSRRTLPLPLDLFQALKSRYEELAQKLPPEALKEAWVFPGEGGKTPVHPDYPNHALRRICQQAGIRPCRVHDLRHTWGSLMLARGVPLEVVSERLGHASFDITLRVYRHVLEEERRSYVLDLQTLLKGHGGYPQA
ncbi:recombinase XerD [Thermus scotoductus]|nr:tyrosine-type recombinase/integrase [Thermus thermophilus]RTH05530.1 recombinase XerD [Thermus scotoductus]RTH27348.1 recombinase XerD [Thermus scotoductus]RTH97734.1 recombinase XerD [Thermus scotoductus]RTI14872.1 recombinase XerD [Thermus scotoductus]RTI41650.1 recombinase XerD [Thermus scotoductus]